MTVPRLHVIPATGCDLALVLRRGPTRQVASLLWDRKSGEVELGQWLNGRIYEHRCDLSSDGRHMIIFAGTGQRWWTALSRAPWLTALAFWPQGHTWHGGGAFARDGTLFLNGATAPADLPDGLKPARPDAFPHATDGFHMGDLYAVRMEQAGWVRKSGTRYETILEKPLSGGWCLRLAFALWSRNRGAISNAYTLISPSGEAFSQKDWTWAEPWADGLQVARAGAIWAGEIGERGMKNPTMIHDFNGMAFIERRAPYEGVAR